MLVQSLTDKFEDIAQRNPVLVLAKPGSILTKCDNSGKISSQKHSWYQTSVGQLLYLTQLKWPDIAIAVGELLHHCHYPIEAHWVALCEYIRHV